MKTSARRMLRAPPPIKVAVAAEKRSPSPTTPLPAIALTPTSTRSPRPCLCGQRLRPPRLRRKPEDAAAGFPDRARPTPQDPVDHSRLRRCYWRLRLYPALSPGQLPLVSSPGWIALPLVLQFIIAATSSAVLAINTTLVSDLCPRQGCEQHGCEQPGAVHHGCHRRGSSGYHD